MKAHAQMPFALRAYRNNPITLSDAQKIIRGRMERRADNFLHLIEHGIYANPGSPYPHLLKHAGIQTDDIRSLLKSQGINETLRTLRNAGVHITFEEFKGRAPIVRGSLKLDVQPGDFDNTHGAQSFYGETSGSTGASAPVAQSLHHRAALAPHHVITRSAHGVLKVPFAIWRGILPDTSGIGNIFTASTFGRPPDKWFSHLSWGDSRRFLRYGTASIYFVMMGRLLGFPIPFPQYVALDKAAIIAHWMRDTLKKYGRCLLGVQVSRALRVAIAAHDDKIDLTGATFMVAGEPPTPAKVREIERTGAKVFSTYGMAEASRIAMGCANPTSCNDNHLLLDSFALITHPHSVGDSSVPAFNITTLLPTAHRLLFNVEIDDYGIVEDRHCGCELESYGFTTHVSEIRSYRKLTGEGVTLVGSEILHILENVLPGQFGGSTLDYQLLEEEDQKGFTRLYLIISPRVTIADEQAVKQVILNSLRNSSAMGDAARAVWQQADSFQIRRSEPVWTARGKLMPLRTEKRSQPG
jgi:hypothetical protein